MEGNTPDVSVVIPTRNRLAYLQEAVRSVQMQTMSDWELIVVDDNSADGTVEWLLDVRMPQLRLIRLDTHLERSAARNLGLQEARGDTVLFLDDDDRLLEGALHYLKAGLDLEPGAIAAVGGVRRFGEGDSLGMDTHVRRRRKRDVWLDVVAGWVGTTGRSLMRTNAIRDIGGFDEGVSFGEDWEMWLRLARAGPVALLPERVLEYRVHPGQSFSPNWLEDRATLLHRHLATLAPQPALRGQRAVMAYDLHRTGLDELAGGDPRKALGRFLRAARMEPSLYVSPLRRRYMRNPLLKSLVAAPFGRTGLRVGQKVLRALRGDRA